VTIIFVVSVGLSMFVCLFVQSFSQPSDLILIKLGHRAVRPLGAGCSVFFVADDENENFR